LPGQETVTSIQQGDQPVVIGFVILASLFVVLANLIVDMSSAPVLDPRVRIS
jgi:peptide/nickel transport system permease protein